MQREDCSQQLLYLDSVSRFQHQMGHGAGFVKVELEERHLEDLKVAPNACHDSTMSAGTLSIALHDLSWGELLREGSNQGEG